MMDNWLRTGQLASDKNGSKCSGEESNENILEDAVAGCSGSGQDRQNTVTPTNQRADFQERTSSKKRKYDESYLSFGFIPVGISENPDGQCVLCSKVLTNSSLAPAKLKRHLETNHPHLKNKSASFFEKQKQAHQAGTTALRRYAKTDGENATKESFLLSYRIARAGKPHTIAENLIKPCLTEIVSCVLGEDAAKKVAAIQCSNNTVSDRIHKISDHIEDELIGRLKGCTAFAMQLDESTDVSGLSILLVFVRYPFEGSIEEDLFLCAPLKTYTTGEEIFNVIDSYMNEHHINWKKCIDVCSDGAAAMTGKIKGTLQRIKNVSPKCTSSHCILHRHALVAKKMPPDLKKVLDQAVQMINYVKSRPLQSRLFKKVCEDMGSQHQSLLLHTEVRWLSRGKVLARLCELRDELKVYFSEQPISTSVSHVELLHDKQWLMKLGYLADIFEKLNTISSSLQGRNVTAFTARDKMSSLKNKFNFWLECVEQKNFECFPFLTSFLEENELEVTLDVEKTIREHLQNLNKTLTEYFPEELLDINWIQNPFGNNKKSSMLTVSEYESLIDIKTSSCLKQKLESADSKLDNFWIGLKDDYPELVEKAMRVLLPFVSTYRCETGFSAYAYTKNKYRNRLDAAPDLRIQLSDISPNFNTIIDKNVRKFHKSH